MIVQNVGQGGKADISFTVPSDDLPEALDLSRRVATTLGATGVSHDAEVAKVSVVGVGMARAEGVAGRMFTALSREESRMQSSMARSSMPSSRRTTSSGLDFVGFAPPASASPSTVSASRP